MNSPLEQQQQQQQQQQHAIDYDVIIIGAGVAGVGAAFHLSHSQQFLKNETEEDENSTCPTSLLDSILVLDAGPCAGVGVAPRYSGSATMVTNAASAAAAAATPSIVKMMVSLYATSSAEFIRHHGTTGAARYLRASTAGLAWQKKLAQQVWGDSETIETMNKSDAQDHYLHSLGSYYVAYAADRQALQEEYNTLKSLGNDVCPDIIWVEGDELRKVPGCSPDFNCAIYFPHDAIIDSLAYSQALIKNAQQHNNKVAFQGNTTVTKVQEITDADMVHITTSTGQVLTCRHVVMATGGLYPAALPGLIKPCYSYLVNVPIDSTSTTTTTTSPVVDASPNFFTWNYTHDWCFTAPGTVRISGEDHYSALKSPNAAERCTRLAQWARQRYGCCNSDDDDNDDFDASKLPQQYGVYSETPDWVPLIGTIRPQSRICYLLGCNAWGQTILSYASSLVPALLGRQALTDEQRDVMKLLTIRRFTQLQPPQE